MTVQQMIDMLKRLPPKAEVTTWDAEIEVYVPVTGNVFHPPQTSLHVYSNGRVELQTD